MPTRHYPSLSVAIRSAQLRDVELWLLSVKQQVPQYQGRAKCLSVRASFASDAKEQASMVRGVAEMARQLRESRAFKKLLSHTLALGNYLNGTSRQGAAWGFKLSALNDLSGCKSIDGVLLAPLSRRLAPPHPISHLLTPSRASSRMAGKMTLLHYLAQSTASGTQRGGLVADLFIDHTWPTPTPCTFHAVHC